MPNRRSLFALHDGVVVVVGWLQIGEIAKIAFVCLGAGGNFEGDVLPVGLHADVVGVVVRGDGGVRAVGVHVVRTGCRGALRGRNRFPLLPVELRVPVKKQMDPMMTRATMAPVMVFAIDFNMPCSMTDGCEAVVPITTSPSELPKRCFEAVSSATLWRFVAK
mgnify:CR=1 FL=1